MEALSTRTIKVLFDDVPIGERGEIANQIIARGWTYGSSERDAMEFFREVPLGEPVTDWDAEVTALKLLFNDRWVGCEFG
jgi:hypothetical protein